MKKLLLVWGVLFIAFQLSAQDERRIHFLKILDTHAPNKILAKAAQAVDRTMDREVNALAGVLGIPTENVLKYDLTGEHFTVEELENTMFVDLGYCRDDIFIITYVGHGYRAFNQTDAYPALYMSGDLEKGIPYGEIIQMVAEHRPSIILSLVNACNNPLDLTYQQPELPNKRLTGRYKKNDYTVAAPTMAGRSPTRYRNLFKKHYSGTRSVEFISASPDYYTFIEDDGGIFFHKFLENFAQGLSASHNASWSTILSKTKSETESLVRARYGENQVPYCDERLIIGTAEVTSNDRLRRRMDRWSNRRQQRYKCRREMQSVRERYRKVLSSMRNRHDKDRKQVRGKSARREMRKRHKQELHDVKRKMRSAVRTAKRKC